MFKVDAHKWMIASAKLGRDAILSESLDAASRGSGEYTVIHRTIQDRFRTLIPDLATGGIDEIVALDNKGRVIARVAATTRRSTATTSAGSRWWPTRSGVTCPTTSGASAASWRAGGAPVLSKKGTDRRRDLCRRRDGPGLVERLKKNLDVDVALLLRGKVIAGSRRPASWTRSPSWSPSTSGRSRSSSARRRCR